MKTLLHTIFIKRFWLKVILLVLIIVISSFWSNYYVASSTKHQIISQMEEIPKKKVGLVLGASKFLGNGIRNPYFYNRIEAAAALFHEGKISHVLVSGDNHIKGYNEPEDMKEALMELGVPENCITMDFAGFRTYDSVVRAKEIFGVSDCVIISQRFHLERALFIANHVGVAAVGYPAKDVGYRGVNLREFGAKYKAFLDCYVIPMGPKFLGEKEFIFASSN
jgi:SanA protein